MTEISDFNAFYGRYVSKKEKAVPLSVARKIENSHTEVSTKLRVALTEIEHAHRELDNLHVPRTKKNTPQFPLSLAGRIRNHKLNLD